MSDLTDKKRRYPMGSPRQVKGTLSRLTRQLLDGKIDVQTYRAAAYGLSVQSSLFKYELPEQQKVDIKIGQPDWILQMSHEERQTKLDELMRKSMPFYDDYLKFAKGRANEINKLNGDNYLEIDSALYWEDTLASVDENSQDEMSMLFNAARRQKTASDTMPPVETPEGQPAEAKAKLEDTGAKWPEKKSKLFGRQTD